MNMAHNPNKDIELLQPPTDGISSLAFSPKANYLVAGSWDHQVWLNLIRMSRFPLSISRSWTPIAFNYLSLFVFFYQVRCWEVQNNGNAIPKASISHDGPVLSVAWSGVCTFLSKYQIYRSTTLYILSLSLHSQGMLSYPLFPLYIHTISSKPFL